MSSTPWNIDNASSEPIQPPAQVVLAEDLPLVAIPGGAVSIRESARKLYEHIAPTRRLFIQADKVTLLKRDDNGSMFFSPVTSSLACSLFEEFVGFRKAKKSPSGFLPTYDPVTISKELADLYLQCEERLRLPIVRGVLNCPMITERNGAIHIVASGYDESTGMYVNGGTRLPAVSLEEAVENLPLILQDFDFQSPGDQSRALAELIAPALKFGRFFNDPVPVSVAEADKSQSGKSYRQQMTAAIYNEELQTVTKKDQGGVGSLDEALSTPLVEGRPFIQLDNVRGQINSTFIESFLTARGTIYARPAYSKQIPVDPSRHFLFINSNGYKATKDLTNRSVIVRIRKKDNFQFRDMLGFIKDYQPLILSWVFEIIKEWHRRGKPRTSEMCHDFREWSQIMDWIVQNIFHAAPLMEGHSEAQNRASSATHSFVREVSLMLEQRKFMNHPLQAGEIGNLCRGQTITIPFLAHEQCDNDEARQMAIGKAMAELFVGDQNQMKIDGFTITRETERVVRDAGKPFVQKKYSFSRAL